MRRPIALLAGILVVMFRSTVWCTAGRHFCMCFDVPTERSRPISSLKPNLFERKSTEPRPVLILPELGIIDEELIQKAHDVLGEHFWNFGKVLKEYNSSGRRS